MDSMRAGNTPADKLPLMPRGGYRRAVPRDALTGEPIRPDSIHKRAYDPLGTRDNGAHSERKRGHQSHLARTPQTRPSLAISHEPLPVLQLDDLDWSAAADAQEGDSTADVERAESEASDE